MLLFVLAATAVTFASAQVLPFGDRGPTQPIQPYNCSDRSLFVADDKNWCWYYQCTPQGLLPRPCALGTHLHSSTRTTRLNPCTERFAIQGMYDCTRRVDPTCDPTKLKCLNGGVATSEGSYCWCDCPPAWQGAPDCSKASPVNITGTTPAYVTCPFVNWCANALPLGVNPCQNNGTCINQCTNFVCDCPRPYSKDRLCSAFSCSPSTSDCPLGQSCNRGLNGRDEFYTCL